MIPSAFVFLDSLPLTQNSKLDRKALRSLPLVVQPPPRDLTAPRTPTERAVAELWSDILRVPQISVSDRFDELGGDSLSFALMTVRAGSVFGVTIPVQMDREMLRLDGFARTVDRLVSRPSRAPAELSPAADPAGVKIEPLRKTWFGRLAVQTISAMLGWVARIELEGMENILPHGPAIVASNHISMFDFLIFGYILNLLGESVPVTPTFIIFEKWRWLVHAYASQLGRTIYIRRGEGDSGALNAAQDVLAQGGVVCIMPEGRPTRGALIRSKPGVGWLVRQTNAPVWPLAVSGHEGIRHYRPRLRRVPVVVRLGRRLEPAPASNSGDDFQTRADAIMEAIAALMPAEYRGEYSKPRTNR